ncbi:MAG: ankyrin repeat domain-containing protein [Deltaproteobacteria bacterium]|nr:ankyrin repeat domain-containing protein [Deltaproteobacteria bacterium]
MVDEEGKMPELIQAIYENNIERVSSLIAMGEDVNAVNYFKTALGVASGEGHTDIVKLLIEHGANEEHHYRSGYTALMMASKKGYTEIIKLLLKHTADITEINFKIGIGSYEYTAVRLAEIEGYQDIVDLLKKAGAKTDADEDINQAVIAMASDGDTKGVKFIIGKGANVNAKDDDGKTVLMFAVEMSSVDLIKFLIEKKADVNAKNNDGNTALMEAIISSCDTGIVKFLIAHGADVNAMNRYGATPLRIALKHRRKRIADLLKKAGAKQ